VALRIRTAEPGDERRLSLVASATFLETFAGTLDGADIVAHCEREHAVAAYAGWLANPDARLWLAETEARSAAVGYLLLAPPSLPLADLRQDDLEVKRIYVLSRFQGGAGSALMDRAVEEARRRGARRLLLGVYARNDRALAFYARHGFAKVGERRFQVGANAYEDVILAREL
jgi:diamine N-acetyltransferase